MLSNLRYNVLLNKSPGNLQCRVVPRGDFSTPISSHNTDEMSFVLNECWISDIRNSVLAHVPGQRGKTVKAGVVEVTYQEAYQDSGSIQRDGVGWVNGADTLLVYKEDRDVDPAHGEVLIGLAV